MRVYQEQRKIRRFLGSGPVLILMSALALFLLITSLRVSVRAFYASKAKEEAELELKELAQQKESVDRKIKDLSDPEFLEKEAKRRFNATLDGEKVLIIVDRLPTDSLEAKPPHIKFWENIKKLFSRDE